MAWDTPALPTLHFSWQVTGNMPEVLSRRLEAQHSGQREDSCGRGLRCRCPELAGALCWAREEWGVLTSAWAKAGLNLSRRLGGVPIYLMGQGEQEPGFPLGFQSRRGVSCLCSVVFSGFVFLVWGNVCRVTWDNRGRVLPGPFHLAGLSPSNHSGDPPNLTVCHPVRPCSP